MAPKEIAFSLAGLGGFNAHGAGFLQAARDSRVEPNLVTATSGQIVVLEAYLRGVPDLGKALLEPFDETNPFTQMQILLFGYKGIFEPALGENITRLMRPPYFGFGIDFMADRFLPAQLYKPTRSRETIARIVETFNRHKTGVVFNAYDPAAGTGMLFGNDAARDLMDKDSKIPLSKGQKSTDPRTAKKGKAESPIHKIDEKAVEAALWLSLYGFAGTPRGLIDGAYHRSTILSELHSFDDVFSCRPLANGWRDNTLPQNYFDVQDWNTEMWFSVGYKAEVDAMKRINSLVQQGAFKDDAKMKEVGLWEVEPDTPAGYFNYFVERQSVYDDAYAKGCKTFADYKARKKVSAAAGTA